MRACEGCRRRKIKCDAATTNSWPCAACVRLKLHCVPPSLNFNRTHSATSISGFERVLDFDSCSSGDEEYAPRPSLVRDVFHVGSAPDVLPSHAGYTDGVAAFSPTSYPAKHESSLHLSYDNVTSMPMTASEPFSQAPAPFPTPGAHPAHEVESTDSWPREEISADDLSEVMGELKIPETGIGESGHFSRLQHQKLIVWHQRPISISRRRCSQRPPPWKSPSIAFRPA
jgi:hypothetical protein